MKHAKGHAFFMGPRLLCTIDIQWRSLAVCAGERGALDAFVFVCERGDREL